MDEIASGIGQADGNVDGSGGNPSEFVGALPGIDNPTPVASGRGRGAKRDRSAEYQRRNRNRAGGTTAAEAAQDASAAPQGISVTQDEVAPRTRRPRAASARSVDAEDAKTLARLTVAAPEKIAMQLVGDFGKMTPEEKADIVEPLARIYQRNPAVIERIGPLADAMAVALGFGYYAMRIRAGIAMSAQQQQQFARAQAQQRRAEAEAAAAAARGNEVIREALQTDAAERRAEAAAPITPAADGAPLGGIGAPDLTAMTAR